MCHALFNRVSSLLYTSVDFLFFFSLMHCSRCKHFEFASLEIIDNFAHYFIQSIVLFLFMKNKTSWIATGTHSNDEHNWYAFVCMLALVLLFMLYFDIPTTDAALLMLRIKNIRTRPHFYFIFFFSLSTHRLSLFILSGHSIETMFFFSLNQVSFLSIWTMMLDTAKWIKQKTNWFTDWTSKKNSVSRWFCCITQHNTIGFVTINNYTEREKKSYPKSNTTDRRRRS